MSRDSCWWWGGEGKWSVIPNFETKSPTMWIIINFDFPRNVFWLIWVVISLWLGGGAVWTTRHQKAVKKCEFEAYLSLLGRVYGCHRGRAKQEVTTRQQKDKSQAADRHLVTVPELPSCTAAGSSPGGSISYIIVKLDVTTDSLTDISYDEALPDFWPPSTLNLNGCSSWSKSSRSRAKSLI